MPLDIFAALGALVRAEAARTAPRPRTGPDTAPARPDEATAPHPNSPAPASAGPPGPAREPAPRTAECPRRGLLRWLCAAARLLRKGRGSSATANGADAQAS
ncbi:hypothetical protein OHA45_04165 [Streptomyces lydicus]|uniref:hypothetical protein n=1 Tax=Streptomyces lydicus TaxID=47763 RepID=UPI002E2FACA5|nr:hypothetical protein [Streptomyces lydicus]